MCRKESSVGQAGNNLDPERGCTPESPLSSRRRQAKQPHPAHGFSLLRQVPLTPRPSAGAPVLLILVASSLHLVMPFAQARGPEQATWSMAASPSQGNSSAPRRALQSSPLGQGYWSVSGRDFVDGQGRVVHFSGVAWVGFETPDAIAQGLDRRPLASHLDQMQQLGFNMIRLTFAGDTLNATTAPTANTQGIYTFNPDFKGLTSVEIMDKIIEGAGQRGMKVILCYHRMHLTVNNEWGVWFDEDTPEDVWVSNWAALATRHRGNPTVVGADLYNEVHNGPGMPDGAPYWVYDAGANEKYNFRRAVARVIREIYAIESRWIFFVEGMWNDYWWGGNVQKLMEAPLTWPANNIAFSSHEYGPYVAQLPYFFQDGFPQNLPGIFHRYWGRVMEQGIKPVWVGEFGSFFPNPNTTLNRVERLAFMTLIKYMKKIKASWTVFMWTPNSKDTGGILTDDWHTPDYRKINLLRPIMHPNFQLE